MYFNNIWWLLTIFWILKNHDFSKALDLLKTISDDSIWHPKGHPSILRKSQNLDFFQDLWYIIYHVSYMLYHIWYIIYHRSWQKSRFWFFLRIEGWPLGYQILSPLIVFQGFRALEKSRFFKVPKMVQNGRMWSKIHEFMFFK